MKMRLFFIRRRNVCGHPSIGCGQIGTAAEETTPPSITQSEPWQFTIAGAKTAIWNIRSINLKRHYSKLLFADLALAPMAFLS